MNKLVYLTLPILEISKNVMHEFCYDYVKLKCDEKTKLCYVGIGSFIVYINTEDIYLGIANDIEIRFDTSNYELERPSPKGEKEKKWD